MFLEMVARRSSFSARIWAYVLVMNVCLSSNLLSVYTYLLNHLLKADFEDVHQWWHKDRVGRWRWIRLSKLLHKLTQNCPRFWKI